MRLRRLELDEFRSFRSLRLAIDPTGFRLVGDNASGKSSLLEAIALAATTRSPHTSAERELLNWESGRDFSLPPYARIAAEFTRADGEHRIDISLSVEQTPSERLAKQVRFDGRPVRAVDAVGQLTCVLFSPDDVSLISGPPAARRRYLDIAISQANRTYLKALSRFGRVLEQRNSLLRSFTRERASPSPARAREQLRFWDEELTATAAEVLAHRLLAISNLNAHARVHFASLTGEATFHLHYLSGRMSLPEPNPTATAADGPPLVLKQAIAAQFASRLEDVSAEELRRGVTAMGPHRDDLAVHAAGVDLGRFGSRGQQRLAVIAIKLAELEMLESARGEAPLLLLDDAFSELDQRSRSLLIDTLGQRTAQMLLTATDDAELREPALRDLPMLHLQGGAIASGR